MLEQVESEHGTRQSGAKSRVDDERRRGFDEVFGFQTYIFCGRKKGGVGETIQRDENMRTLQVSDTRRRSIDSDETALASIYRSEERTQTVHSDAGIKDREEGQLRKQDQSVYSRVVDADVAADIQPGERVFQAEEVVDPAKSGGASAEKKKDPESEGES